MQTVSDRGLVLLGCGKMGSAMLSGWLARGLAPASVFVIDPNPSDWVLQTGARVNEDLPGAPAVVIIAVKPQMMGDALPALQGMGGAETLFISVAAGTPLAQFEAALGAEAMIVRAMPNTPAAVGQGITALIGNAHVDAAQMDLAEGFMQAVGTVVRLESEDQMDAVTGVSGSGPAYVFHLIETLAAGGVAQGLSKELAMQLAKATVAGAGALAIQAQEDPSQLRVNVTSPNGTTQAALEVLMDGETGFPSLLTKAVAAATNRSKELANG